MHAFVGPTQHARHIGTDLDVILTFGLFVEHIVEANDRTHLLQIWLFPGKRGIEPSYEQVRLPQDGLDGRLVLVAAPPGEKSAVTIHTPSRIYASRLASGGEVSFENKAKRHVWIQVARGQGRVNDIPVGAGDGVRTSDPGVLQIVGGEGGLEVLLFDLD